MISILLLLELVLGFDAEVTKRWVVVVVDDDDITLFLLLLQLLCGKNADTIIVVWYVQETMLQTKIIDTNSILRAAADDDDDDDDDDNGTKVTIVEVVGCAAVLETITILVRFILIICIPSVILYSMLLVKNKSNDDLELFVYSMLNCPIQMLKLKWEWMNEGINHCIIIIDDEEWRKTKKLLLMPVNLLAFFFVKVET